MPSFIKINKYINIIYISSITLFFTITNNLQQEHSLQILNNICAHEHNLFVHTQLPGVDGKITRVGIFWWWGDCANIPPPKKKKTFLL